MTTINNKWMVSKSFDLAYFISPVLLSFIALSISYYEILPIFILFWVFTIFFDTPHLFFTYVRTYFDKSYFNENRVLLMSSFLWFLLGPLCFVLGIVLESHFPFTFFVIFASAYGYWHILRQHYGFFSIYQKLNGEISGYENKIEYTLFHLSLLLPVPLYILKSEALQKNLGVSNLINNTSEFSTFFSSCFITTLLIYVLTQLNFFSRGKLNINLPKNLFFLSVILLPLSIIYSPLGNNMSFSAFLVVITIFHNVQYGAIVWFYSRNRYHSNTNVEYGLATKLTKNIFIFLFFCIFLGILYRYSFWTANGSNYPFVIQSLNLETSLNKQDFSNLIYAVIMGIALQHYHLDQKIWKVSKDQKLSQDLKVKSTSS